MRVYQLVCLLGSVLLLAACGGKPVKTYEGDALAEDEVVLLTAGENIEIASIDGKRMTQYLLSNIETNYELAPGKHQVVFNYTSVWAVSGKRDDDESPSELVESEPHVVEFDARPGERLRFDFPEVGNVREAKRFAADFSADLVDSSGRSIATSVAYVPQEQVATQQVAVVGGAAVAGKAPSSPSLENNLPALEAMKVMWESASAEDKKAFLKWAFQ